MLLSLHVPRGYVQDSLERIEATVGILQSNSHSTLHLTARDVGKQSGHLSYLETQRELVAIAGAGSNFS